MVIRMKGLYIHIPFCEKLCHYCDFVKQVPQNDEIIDSYMKALIEEVKSYKDHYDSIETIYIGGGTPSMLKVEQIEPLLKELTNINPIEYTIEINPESYEEEKGLLYKKYNINRTSMGVQTFNDAHLEFLNRGHTSKQVIEVIDHLNELDFNISIDLIYALPNQTLDEVKQDLEIVKKLKVNHISCYSLILEEKTFFYHLYLKGLLPLVSNDLEALMFETIKEQLVNIGFHHYEISNFAKDGYESLHNKIYWTNNEYIGTGAGAHGFIDGYRTFNKRGIRTYIKEPLDEKVLETKTGNIQNEMIFGLRLIKGVNISNIEDKYEIDLFEMFPEMNEHIDNGLLQINDGNLSLTEKGILFGNVVFRSFVWNI